MISADSFYWPKGSLVGQINYYFQQDLQSYQAGFKEGSFINQVEN